MSQCLIYLYEYEKALSHIHIALKCSQTEIPMLLRIKLKYRLALCLMQLRDYSKCAEVLKHLKTYCNLEHELEMSKLCIKVWE